MTAAELEKLVIGELPLLYRVARRYVREQHDAEDLVASTIASAFKDPSKCDGRFPVAWILRIMRNRFLQDIRQSQANVPMDEAIHEVTDPRSHTQYLQAIARIDITVALDAIPEDYRMVIALCDIEGLDYREAALALDVPIGTVRSRLSRGRKILVGRLASWASHE